MLASFVKTLGMSLVLGASMLVGCGSSGPETTGATGATGATGSTGTGAAMMFDCDASKCQAGTQYCLESYLNNTFNEAKCVALPSGCSSCDCAESDAPKQYPTSNNCSSTVSCGQENDSISVRCDAHL